MREPNIKELVESLAEEDFVEGIFQRNRDAYEEVSQLMYFLRREQVATLYNEISELKEDKKQRVFTSLVKLYPMSQDIVKHLVIKREKAPVDFLHIYDRNKELLDSFKKTVKELKESSYSNSSEYNRYQKELETLGNEISELKTSLQKLYESESELKEARDQKANLEAKRQELIDEYTHGNLEHDIENLKQEIENLKAKQRQQSEEKKRLKKELDEMAGELKREESAPAYQDALSALVNCIKAIPGER